MLSISSTCFQYLWENDFTIRKTNKCEQKVGIQFAFYSAYFSLLFPFLSLTAISLFLCTPLDLEMTKF